jgi:arginyl-tRNA synthetase
MVHLGLREENDHLWYSIFVIQETIKNLITQALKELDLPQADFVVEHPGDLSHGDYSTNVAMVLSKQAGQNPRDLAGKIVEVLEKNLPAEISKVEAVGPGFINFHLSRGFFTGSIQEILRQKENWGKNTQLLGKKVMVEYTQPNPFKPFHIGHLMSNAIGESISRIVEFSGAKTIRANYQGDVGPHVAKAIWGILNSGESHEGKTALWVGEQYAKGSDAYDNLPEMKAEIDVINKKVYEKTDPQINEIYNWGRKVTLDAFEEIYTILGTKFDHYFFESDMAPIGQKIVTDNIGKVFTESDGAIVFHAENYDPKLHTRVFINSKGLPTYETKEIGLTVTKFEKENPDLSIITTAIEQGEYMKIVAKALSLIHPGYEARMKHITHGMMRLATGKMSSRKGNVITGESLITDSMDVVRAKIAERELTDAEKDSISKIVGVAALKYSILRSSLGSDIVYDFEKSISFEGDSGPYLQYTGVRAQSILKKAQSEGITLSVGTAPSDVVTLEKMLYRFPEVVSHAYNTLEPHHLVTYLSLLSAEFNSFYASVRILESDHAPYYLTLVEAFHQTMENGLYLLGIRLPSKM